MNEGILIVVYNILEIYYRGVEIWGENCVPSDQVSVQNFSNQFCVYIIINKLQKLKFMNVIFGGSFMQSGQILIAGTISLGLSLI